MNDRKLLELAAKAAGINLYVWGSKGSENFADMDAYPQGKRWNPLTDDGDALRLAVKLGMEVYVDTHPEGCGCTEVRSHTYPDGGGVVYSHDGDPLAATRRAIVRAAAAIAATTKEAT